ncbi:MAG: hypothetical protein K5636_03470 [Bacteroidales bacterium]|nr:hypothetical protein [Bacteroidales bacterium]
MRRHILLILLMWCPLFVTIGTAQTADEEKAFVSALSDFIQQQHQSYRYNQVPVCSLALQIQYVDDYLLESHLGSLTANRHQTYKTMKVYMIVGNPQAGRYIESTTNQDIYIPLDFNSLVAKQILKDEIHRLYTEAEQEYRLCQARAKVGTPWPSNPTFSPLSTPSFVNHIYSLNSPYTWESLEDYFSPETKPEHWGKTLNEYTQLWNTLENIHEGKAVLHNACLRIYKLDQEGAVIASNYDNAILTISATALDSEHRPLTFEKQYMLADRNDLPRVSTIHQDMMTMNENLLKMVESAQAENIHCPVLFASPAAAQVLYHAYLSQNRTLDQNAFLTYKEPQFFFELTATTPLTEKELIQKLKQQIRMQGDAYGYYVKSIRYDEKLGFIAQEAYRVYGDDKSNEPVHGFAFADASSLWSQVIACGNEREQGDLYVPAFELGAPVVCLAPSVLCAKAKTYALNTTIPLSLLSPAPETKEVNSPFSEFVFQAMQEEFNNFMEDTLLQTTPKPYNVEYLITDAKTFTLKSILGSTVTSTEEPVRSVTARVLVGDDQINNTPFSEKPVSKHYNLPLDIHYNNTLHTLHQATEDAYRQALVDYALKQDQLEKMYATQNTILDDRSKARTKSFFISQPDEPVNMSHIQDLANNISAFFPQDSLIHSSVEFTIYQGMTYCLSTPNVQYSQLFNLIALDLRAETSTDNGELLQDHTRGLYQSISDLPTTDELINQVNLMVDRLREFRSAPTMNEIYDGPVLVSGEAVPTLFVRAFLDGDPSLLADRTAQNYWENFKNKSVASNNVSVIANYKQDQFKQTSLLGHYTVDAEGVPTHEKFTLIDNGSLIGLITNRIPTRFGRYSNGHQRLYIRDRQLTTDVGPGVLEMTCRNIMEEVALEKELLKQARSAGYKYAYEIVKTSEDGLQPLFVYRIKVSNGQKTPVRLVRAEPLDISLFSCVNNASNDQNATNLMFGGQETDHFSLSGTPISIIAPTQLLFGHIKLQP